MSRNHSIASRRITSRAVPALALALSLALSSVGLTRADEPAGDSAMVKLLKSGRVPEARQGAVVELIGKRGTLGDLDFIYRWVLDGTAPEAIRQKSIDALFEAATTRGMRPSRDCERLVTLLSGPSSLTGTSLQASAVRLAGAWKLEASVPALRGLARSSGVAEALRESAIDALATIGGLAGRSAIEDLAGPGQGVLIRESAVAALARLDVTAAAALATRLLPAAAESGSDLKPLVAAFLDHRGGGAALAVALGNNPIPPDAAKLALRAAYSLGQSDPALSAALGRAAGIDTQARPPDSSELAALVAEVAAKGDPVRGEAVFRRSDLNCMTCHAIARAGGEIGPDLSAIGQTSPPDYIIQSILMPDQSIKEQYHTLIVQTTEGQVYQGIVTDRDDRRVILKDSTGALRTVPVASIEEQKAGGSLMPKGLTNLMTHREFIDLVRFLSELGRPGPYAIRTTPTIQRWRVLKPVPQRLADAVPDAETLREQVLEAPADRWVTVYARVSGSLPLAEVARACGEPRALYVQGELNVTAHGTIRIEPAYPEAIRFWVDDLPAPAGTREFTTSVTVGRHLITVRVETAERSHQEVRLTVDKPEGSTAEFTVVGGK